MAEAEAGVSVGAQSMEPVAALQGGLQGATLDRSNLDTQIKAEELLSTGVRQISRTTEPVKPLIPNIVFFTGTFEPELIVANNRKFVPRGTEFRFYDNQQVDMEVHRVSQDLEREANIPGVHDAFRALRPWAFRSDLWRLVTLWAHGGVYIDAKIVLTAPISTWVDQKSDTLALCLDTGMGTETGRYWNAVMASAPKTKELESVIRFVVQNVARRSYGVAGDGHADLSITGPVALTEALRAINAVPRADCSYKNLYGAHQIDGWGQADGTGTSIRTRETLFATDRKVHDQMHSGGLHGPSYGELFWKREVYCDTGPPCSDGSLALPGLPTSARYWSKVV